MSIPLFSSLLNDNPEKLLPGLRDSLQPALLVTARRYNLVGVARRSIRAESWYPAPAGLENCHGARRAWRGFCRPDTSFVSYTSVAVQC
jgi:hypothetical protein